MLLKRIYLRNYRVYEDELDLELPPGLVGIYGANGSGKCLPGGTRVWDAELGEGITIEQFVAERREWMLGYTGGRATRVQVTDWHQLGDKPTVAVRLSSGAEIEVASTHPLLTDRGCVEAGRLQTGDWVAEVRSLPAVGPPRVTNDEALILGMLLGDGCMTHGVSLSAWDDDVADAFRAAVERTFPYCTTRGVCHKDGKPRSWIVVSALTKEERRTRRSALAHRLLSEGLPVTKYVGETNFSRFIRGHAGLGWEAFTAIAEDYGLDLWEEQCALHGGRALLEWVRSFGLIGHGSHTKRVPANLLLLPDAQAAHLVAGLWLTDGYVGFCPEGSGASVEVSYTTASSGLADDLRVLLLRLGIHSTRTVRRSPTGSFHTVSVTTGSFQRMAALPLVGRKATRISRLVKERAGVALRPLHDLLPPSFCANLPTTSKSGRQRTRIQLQTHGISREHFLDFGGASEVSDAETLWSRVKNVTPTGRSVPCFDVTVDTPEHLYLADTFIVHNSYLCESVLFALWGRARTTIADVRTTGVNADCVAEVQFEHEGHLYTVRRTITGTNATVKASAFADGQQVAEGVRDTGRYVHSILGMDDAAFRSSVFAEQKQLAAFSNQRPQQRKDLVLRLLGVMPLDTARDDARRDARLKREQLESLTAVLPDLVELRHAADDAAARAEAAGAEAATEEQVAATARARLSEAQERLDAMEALGRRHEQVVAEGRAAREQHEALERRVTELEGELAQLAEADTRLEAVAGPAEGAAAKEAELADVKAVAGAAAALARAEVPDPPPAPDEEGCEAARAEAEQAANRLAGVEGELGAARAELARAEEAAGRSDVLSGEAECPLCGQALGDAFGQVQAHRATEVERGRARVAELERTRAGCQEELAAARARAAAAASQLKRAREAWQDHQRLAALRASAEAALAEAEGALGRPYAPGELDRLSAEVEQARAAAAEAARLRVLLERRPALVAQHEAEQARRDAAADRLEELRATARALGFHPDQLQGAREQRAGAAQAAEATAKLAGEARLEAEKLGVAATEKARRLADAEAQHGRLAELVEETRHLGRVADLLSAFRNSVVATVGPRLATQAADLFAELTDHEYDELKLNPDTYEIQICDRGLDHGMARFSGSETDLANLAVRVAISEHVRLLSGGSVGLLVLDEVFGPLDEDRKRRVLGALQRLKGRFRQVLVVTHDDAVKAELPHAIEVVKLPGRRATARLVTA